MSIVPTNTLIRFLVLLIVTATAFGNACAQLSIHAGYAGNTVTSVPEVFFFSIDNTLPGSFNIQIVVSIDFKKKGNILTATSRPVTLNPGSTVFSSELLSYMSLSYSAASKDVITNQVFAPGDYNVCYKVYNVTDNLLLGDYCTEFSVANEQPVSTDPNKKKSRISTSGSSELLFNYSSAQSMYTSLPPTYLNWTFNPQVTVFDIPFSARIFLSTMQVSGQQDMNSYSFQFDANQFRNILKTKLLEYLQKQKELNKVAGFDFGPFITEHDNISGILSNPAVVNEINQIKELDSLRTQLENAQKNVTQLSSDVSGYGDKITSGDTSGMSQLYSGTQLSGKDSIARDTLSGWKDKLQHGTDSLGNTVAKYTSDPTALGEEAIDSLKTRIKALEWLESKRPYYNKLLERKAKIEEYGQKFGLMDSSGNFTTTDPTKDVDMGRLSDPNYLYQKLKSNKLMRKLDKVLYAVRSLSVGMSVPQYSALSLNGMAVNGFSIELEQFNVYAAFTYGTVMNPVLTTNIQHASYQRKLMGGSFGYGSKDKSHIHVTILTSTDDTTSINPRDSLYLYAKLPQDNKVISIDGQLNLLKNKLIIGAEFSGSQTVKDITNYVDNNIIGNTPSTDPSNWFVNIFTQERNVKKGVVDYAISAKIEAKLFKDKTTLSASFKRVGPNYYSFGLPFLIRDMMTIEVKASQTLWKDRIQLSAYVRRNNDNLENTKLQTTEFYNYGLDFSLRVPKWPSLKIGITPVTLQSDTSYFNMMAFNVNSSYNFKLRKVQNIVSLSFIKQMSAANDTNLYFDINYVTFLYSIGIRKGPTVNFNSSYINSNSDVRKDTWVVGAGASMTAFKIWNNILGGNCYISNSETRWGAYVQSSVNLLKYFTLSLRVENNQFNTYLNLPGVSDYTQFTCRTSITARW